MIARRWSSALVLWPLLIVPALVGLAPGGMAARGEASQVPSQAANESSHRLYLPWVGRDSAPRLALAGNVGGATWSVAGGGDVAVMGVGLRLVAVDLVIPSAPRLPGSGGEVARLLGEFGPLRDYPYGLALQDAVLYVANGYEGLRIYDAADPSHLREISAIATTDAAYAVTVDGGRAYVSAGSQGLVILDVTDPTQPRWLGTFDGPGSVRKAVVDGDRALVASSQAGLFLVDVRDPARPIPLGGFNPAGWVDTVALVGTHAVIRDFVDLVVLDVAAAAPPREVARLTIELLDGDTELAAAGTVVYASGDDFLAVVDVGDPLHPRQLDDVLPDTRELVPLAVTGDLLLAGDGYIGALHLVDVSRPAAPAVLGRYAHDDLGEVFRLSAAGDRLLVWATDLWGMNGGTVPPAVLGQSLEVQVHGDMTNDGQRAYLASYGLDVVDLTDPAQLAYLGHGADGWILAAPAVEGSVLAALGGRIPLEGGEVRAELAVVDVTDDAQPQVVGRFDTHGEPYSVALAPGGRWAYVAEADCRGLACLDPHGSLIEVVDLADPTAPRMANQIAVAQAIADVAVADRRLYLAQAHGVAIYDLAEPAAPLVVGRGERHRRRHVGQRGLRPAHGPLGGSGLRGRGSRVRRRGPRGDAGRGGAALARAGLGAGADGRGAVGGAGSAGDGGRAAVPVAGRRGKGLGAVYLI